MNDQDIQDRIEAIEAEEVRLRADEATHSGDAGAPELKADRERLAQLRDELEELWALLRRRRALRDAGQDPDGA
jgi:molybdenum cofactor biosynthesis enzyme MoaA